MATQQAISHEAIAANGNGKAAPEKRELTPEERVQKANRLMEKAWDMIYEDNQKATKTQKSDA